MSADYSGMRRRYASAGLLALIAFAGCGDEENGGLVDGLVGEPPRHVSKKEQRMLPTAAYTLPDIACPPNYYDPKTAAQVAKEGPAQTRAFFRALREHPDAIVDSTFTLAHPEGDEDRVQTEQISIRDLAETHLTGLDDVGDPALPPKIQRGVVGAESYRCRVKLKRKLERLIERAD